jgi:hypothetical protein
MACDIEGKSQWVLGLASIRWQFYRHSILVSPVPVFWAPSCSLTSSILHGLASTSRETQPRKITSKACNTSIDNQSILYGLVLLGDGLLSRAIAIVSI